MDTKVIPVKKFASLANQGGTALKQKALRIYINGGIKLSRQNQDMISFTCKSEGSGHKTFYSIYFGNISGTIEYSCECLYYKEHKYCKHISACALFISKQENEKKLNSSSSNPKTISDAVVLTTFLLKDYKHENDFTRKLNGIAVHNYYQLRDDIQFKDAKQGHATILYKKAKIELYAHTTEEVDMSCTCKNTKPCFHQLIVLNELFKYKYGFIESLLNFNKIKSSIINEYSLPDDLVQRIPFNIKTDGRIVPSSSNVNDKTLLGILKSAFATQRNKDIAPQFDSQYTNKDKAEIIYMCYEMDIEFPSKYRFLIKPIIGRYNKNGSLSKKLDIFNTYNFSRFSNNIENSLADISLAQNLSRDLEKTRSIDGFVMLYHWNYQPDELLEYIHPTVEKYWNEIASNDNIFFRKVMTNALESDPVKISLSRQAPQAVFEVAEKDSLVSIKYMFEGTTLFDRKSYFVCNRIIKSDDTLYLLDKHMVDMLEIFAGSDNNFVIAATEYNQLKYKILYPIMSKAKVNFKNKALEPKMSSLTNPTVKVYLKEYNEFFMLIPAFEYDFEGETFEVELDRLKISQNTVKGELHFFQRDEEAEINWEIFFRSLHPHFEKQLANYYYYLPQNLVLTDNWFFQMFDSLKAKGIEILGIKELKKIKYSPFRPKIRVAAGSGIDWFDLSVNISFGDEKVSLQELRKALYNKQKFVTLSDGTLGMLPEEWVAKYNRIITAGKIIKDKVQFNQFQYGLIDHLYEEIDNNQTLLELREKRKKLLSFKEIKKHLVPKKINAALRDYQVEGYNWLRFLDEFGWGGCLADDMGLGKTLQMLAFIQSKADENPDAHFLVVVPASLVFNWKKETEKFTPHLKVLVHTGANREKEHQIFLQHHIIITTYALARIDIASLKEFQFDYVILDESQAIKNPVSLTSKAMKLLKATNRFVMTGTPVENNTFDLYSQFDFLNPGMLGSLENFREQFANKIDRDRDQNAAEALRRLIYPFTISRKKDQVAKDLPPKTETVIYCEMLPPQRKIYDKFKKSIREDVQKTIEEKGLGSSGIAVLQGLLKLRQICNSPLLLNDDTIHVGDSVKLDLLMENVLPVVKENHKVLIFSFFVEMLELIKARLEQEQIRYAWITGQSSDRQAQVEQFQEEDDCMVFLISLKAGGVGLNLTSAEYVYLVDPWWNPAVEQQAIDRAHRIGQTKNIFAYKMICKDSIEEKILELQEKKRAVASELINIEQGLLKKLSQEDIINLFN